MLIQTSKQTYLKILRFTQEHYPGRYTVFLSEYSHSRLYLYSLDGVTFAAREVRESRPFPFFFKRKKILYFLDADSPHIQHLSFLINPKKEILS